MTAVEGTRYVDTCTFAGADTVIHLREMGDFEKGKL